MFDCPGLRTATTATEKGTPQAAPRLTFVPGNRKVRMSPRVWTAAGGQFEARTTSLALFAFAARRTSRSPNRTSPVAVATRKARETSITGRPLGWVPPALRVRPRERGGERGGEQEREREQAEPARASASESRRASAGPRAVGKSGSRPPCPG